MLMVSQLLRVARGESSPDGLRRSAPSRFGADRPPVVVWNVCRHCNMTCPHCYAAAVRDPSPKDLTTAEALDVVRQLAEAGVKVVIVSGGEPLLRHDLFTLLAAMRDAGLSPQLSTNGVLLDAGVARRLREHGVGYVGVSIDGLRDFHDEYRGLPGGFDRAWAGLAHAKAAGLRTGLRVTLTRRNVGQVGSLLALATERGVDRFYASHLVWAGRGFRMAGDDLDPTTARALLWTLFELADEGLEGGGGPDVVTGSNDSDGALLLAFVAERHGEAARGRVEALLLARGGNSAGEGILNVDHQGRVHPDQFWPAMTLADLRREPFTAALAHPFREELRTRAQRLEGRCGACRFVALCRGSHRERALAATGRTWASDPACVMTDAEIARAPVPAEAVSCAR